MQIYISYDKRFNCSHTSDLDPGSNTSAWGSKEECNWVERLILLTMG